MVKTTMPFFHLLPAVSVQDIKCYNTLILCLKSAQSDKRGTMCTSIAGKVAAPFQPLSNVRPEKDTAILQWQWRDVPAVTTSTQLCPTSQQEAYLRMIFNSLLIWPIFSVYSTNISYLLNLLLSQYRFSIKYVQLLALQTVQLCLWSVLPSRLMLPLLDFLRLWEEESCKALNVQNWNFWFQCELRLR